MLNPVPYTLYFKPVPLNTNPKARGSGSIEADNGGSDRDQSSDDNSSNGGDGSGESLGDCGSVRSDEP
jgi:hypothetical protein